MEEPACHVFKSKHDRSVKRRRLNHDTENDNARRREALFQQEWTHQNARFHLAIDHAHSSTFEAISVFVQNAPNIRNCQKVPTGLIATGSSSSSGSFDQAAAGTSEEGQNVCVTLSPSDGPSLKTVLRNLINRITQQNSQHSDDEDERPSARFKGPRLLNYDLQIIHEWQDSRHCKNIIIAIRDSEAFDANVFSDLVTLLHSWLDRLPVVLLVGIATSVDMFHDPLPVSVIKCMQGEQFDVTETDQVLEDAFKCCTAAGGAKLHIGPEMASVLLQRSKDHLQSVEAFRQSVKYAHMSHFYGNPASILCEDSALSSLSQSDFDAIRNLPSFKQHIEHLLSQKQASHARKLLQSDKVLLQEVKSSLSDANVRLEWLCGALHIIQRIRQITSAQTSHPAPPFSTLYIKALSGTLTPTSPQNRDLLLSMRRLPSTSAIEILTDINDTLISMPPSTIAISPDDFIDLADELEKLTSNHGDLPASFTTTSNIPAKTSTTPTTQYTQILTRFHDLLSTYLTATLPTQPYTSIFLHELIFLGAKTRTLWRGAFTPAPRTAIERALSAPHDYLGCDCCEPGGSTSKPTTTSTAQQTLSEQPSKGKQGSQRSSTSKPTPTSKQVITPTPVSDPTPNSPNKSKPANRKRKADEAGSTLPPTALLYQLYLESGPLINVADLWMAFTAQVLPRWGAATHVNGRATSGPADGMNGTGSPPFDEDVDDDDADMNGSKNAVASGQEDGEGTDGGEGTDEEQEDGDGRCGEARRRKKLDPETRTRLLFMRGLAELKYMGMVRPSRRKVDCVGKALWKGL